MYKCFCLNRGPILGLNPDKSLKSFPPCYSMAPLYSIALRFLFLHTHATSRKEKWGKPDRNPYQLPYGLRNPYRNLKSRELSRLYPETSMKLHVHEFGFSITVMQLLVLLKRGRQCHDITAFTDEFFMALCPWLRFFQNSTLKSYWDIRVFRPKNRRELLRIGFINKRQTIGYKRRLFDSGRACRKVQIKSTAAD